MRLNKALAEAIKHWDYLAPIVKYPSTSKEYDLLVHHLDQLLDIVGHNEKHELMGLVDLLSKIINDYEEKKYHAKLGSGINALKFLMQSHGLSQSDIPEIGSQGVISELYSGKRKLNIRQIQLLAKKFKVDPSTFIN
jgi:HTH-type transcriptional regulator/antitoxin HigA